MNYGDRVKYLGKLGVICGDNYNGTYDIAFDLDGQAPKVGSGQFWCSGTAEGVERDDIELVEKAKCPFVCCEKVTA